MRDEIPAVIDGRSRVLGSYAYLNRRSGGFLFRDGVRYTLNEALILSKGREEHLPAIHMVKKVFDGTVIGHQRLPWRGKCRRKEF